MANERSNNGFVIAKSFTVRSTLLEVWRQVQEKTEIGNYTLLLKLLVICGARLSNILITASIWFKHELGPFHAYIVRSRFPHEMPLVANEALLPRVMVFDDAKDNMLTSHCLHSCFIDLHTHID